MKKVTVLLQVWLTIILFPASLCAQWSSDPWENTLVRDTSGWFIVPKIASTASGNTYISWYSSTEGFRFDVCLQRFDHDGNKLWDEHGLLVSNHPTESWVTDFGLAVDQDDAAILTVQDLRDGYSNAFAYRITPDGNMQWGPDGIRLTNTSSANYAPQVLVLDNNSYLFLVPDYPLDTTQVSTLQIMNLDTDGNTLWEKNIVNDTMDIFLPQMLLIEDGNFMISWLAMENVIDTMMGQENYVHIFLQKFGADGSPLWAKPAQADSGNIILFNSVYTLPWLANDGANGAYIMWQSFHDYTPAVLVNRFGSEGQMLWDGYGLPVSLKPGSQHGEPSMLYSVSDDALFVFWREYMYDPVNMTDCWGVAGQKFAPDGMRLWADTAKMIVPLLCDVYSTYLQVNVKDAGDETGFCVFYQKDFLEMNGQDTLIVSEIYATMLDEDGNYLWTPENVPVTMHPSCKEHLAVGNFSTGQWITAWDDDRLYSGQSYLTGIYAQNVTYEGNLGPLKIPDALTAGKSLVGSYPNPFSDRLTVDFELNSAHVVNLTIYDISGRRIQKYNYGRQNPGRHTLDVETTSLPPGLYFLHINTGTGNQVIKIVKGNNLK